MTSSANSHLIEEDVLPIVALSGVFLQGAIRADAMLRTDLLPELTPYTNTNPRARSRPCVRQGGGGLGPPCPVGSAVNGGKGRGSPKARPDLTYLIATLAYLKGDDFVGHLVALKTRPGNREREWQGQVSGRK